MKSKENFPENSYGERLISYGSSLEVSSFELLLNNDNEKKAFEKLNCAIDYYRQALAYKESENHARLALGKALICRYDITFLRTDLDKAIENLLVVKAEVAML